MIYRNFQGKSISELGFGGMRLPVINGVYGNIDEDATREMVEYAYKHGVNYYDTAWGYHDGASESVLGKILADYPRDSFYLATKFPGYDLSNMDKVEEIFEEQLRKCKVEYFDFYLFHNVCEMNIDAYLDDKKYGIFTYLKKQKELGRIKHLGFSAHGSRGVIERFLEAYGKDMEFCQLQLNWLDWTFQSGKEKYELLSKWNIPVWVMEPLRGGKLAKLGEGDAATLRALRPDEDIPAWSFRFLQGLSKLTVILSGMSNAQQLKDNIKTFAENRPLNDEEVNALASIAEGMVKKTALPCTACRYCTSHCPRELDIPALISLYNEHVFTGGGFIAPMALAAVDEDKLPSACVKCRSCEQVCPQGIKISDMMSDFSEKLRG